MRPGPLLCPSLPRIWIQVFAQGAWHPVSGRCFPARTGNPNRRPQRHPPRHVICKKEDRPEAADHARSKTRNQSWIDFLRSTGERTAPPHHPTTTPRFEREEMRSDRTACAAALSLLVLPTPMPPRQRRKTKGLVTPPTESLYFDLTKRRDLLASRPVPKLGPLEIADKSAA